jgi:hypothetical protein
MKKAMIETRSFFAEVAIRSHLISPSLPRSHLRARHALPRRRAL